MPIVRVAIVGRPNVGKSSILNMLAKAKVSIVDPTPGVTRDRVTHMLDLEGPTDEHEHRLIELTDTGGYGVYTADGARFDDAGEDLQLLTGDIERQIAAAVKNADLILFVLDAQAGITSLDETVAGLLRTTIDPRDPAAPTIIPIANKVDAMNWEPHGLEVAALGLGEPWLLSAKNNYKRREFREQLWHAATDALDTAAARVDNEEPGEMKIALVGRRNAGKSSFVNALAGQERCIVSEIAGTTRDAIDVRFELDGKTLVAIDTAGVRRRTKFADRVEHFANMRAEASILRADVVLFLIDATEKIAGIDKRLGAKIADAHKPTVIVVSKWDLAQGRKNRDGKPVTPDDYAKYINDQMPGLRFAPIVFTSSTENTGLAEAVSVAFDLRDQARERLSTSRVNRLIRDIVDERGPSSALGTRLKIYFASQVTTEPPTIVLVVNKPELFEDTYVRFILNRIRENTPFTEVPVRLIIRKRRRADLKDMKARGYAAAHATDRAAGSPADPDDEFDLRDDILAGYSQEELDAFDDDTDEELTDDGDR